MFRCCKTRLNLPPHPSTQTHSRKREHEMLKRKRRLEEEERERKRGKETARQMEEERRKEGLERRLDSSNRGFAMLQKMGYKAGQSVP